MKRFCVVGGLLSLVLAMIVVGQGLPEAPQGFDGQTNGSVPQNVMDADSATFQEVESISPSGLGPTYNETSCAHCHFNQAIGGASQISVLRAGHYDFTRPAWFKKWRNRFDTTGSIGTFVAATAVTANGTPVPDRSLINQRATCPAAQEHLTAADNIHSMRLTLPTNGDGYVEAVPDAELLAIAAKNGGEAIQVPIGEANGVTAVGKFGLKDQHASLLSFSGDAYLNEMGITNALNPDEVITVCNPAGISEPNDPNAATDDIHQFAEFMRALKVPPRGPITAAVTAGAALFDKIGCTSCHVATLTTAPSGTAINGGTYIVSDAIGGKQFHPYSDFLLHSLGQNECEGIQQNGPADTICKMRTMPLWGVSTRTQLMHDAQSPTYGEAIQRHGGEAADEQNRFNRLSNAQQQEVLAFLGSL